MNANEEPQVIYQFGDPRHYCMGCDHYHDPDEGCAAFDHLDRGYVIDKGRERWPLTDHGDADV